MDLMYMNNMQHNNIHMYVYTYTKRRDTRKRGEIGVKRKKGKGKMINLYSTIYTSTNIRYIQANIR